MDSGSYQERSGAWTLSPSSLKFDTAWACVEMDDAIVLNTDGGVCATEIPRIASLAQRGSKLGRRRTVADPAHLSADA